MPTSAPAYELRDRRLAAWAVLCACALWAVLAWPWWHGEVYLADDMAAFHLPLRKFYHDCLHAGRPFDWLPTLFAGFYITGEGQLGGYHPLHWLLYRTLPLPSALGLEVLLSYPVTFGGMWFWLRGRGLSRAAACTGGLLLTFSSFQLLHLPHVNAVAILAHLPWLLLLVDRWAATDSQGHRSLAVPVAIALLTGSQILLGYPQYVWFSLLVETAYGLMLWHTQGCARGAAAGWLLVKAGGVALGAVQLVPTLEALAHSTRQAADASLPYYGSLHPLNLLQWIGPYLFNTRVVGRNTHELGCYLGAVPLMLVVWSLSPATGPHRLHRGAASRWLTRTVAVISGVAVWLALGEDGGMYQLQTWLPAVGKFRFPARYVSIVCWGAATLAALSLGELQRAAISESSRRSAAPMAWLAAFSAAVAIMAPWLFPVEHVAAWPLRLAGPALLLVAGLLVAAAQRGTRGALPALVLLATVDLGAYGLSHSLLGKTGPLEEVYRQLPGVPGQAGHAVAMQLRGPDESVSPTTNQLALCGVRTVDGYAGLEPARRLDYTTLPALRAAGVQFVGRTNRTAAVAGLLPFDNQWLAVPEPLPRVRFVTHVLVDPEPGQAMAQVDLEKTAVVSRPLSVAVGPPGVATLLSDEPGSLSLRVTCATPQLLVIADSYHTGWRATVDGRSRGVERVNGDFLGVLVMPGESDVGLRFAPVSLQHGRNISRTALAALAAICIGGSLRRPKQNKRSVRRALPMHNG